MIYVLVGRSISVGLLLGGRLHAGHNGAAGEIGVLRDVGWYTAFDRLLSYGKGDPAEAAKRVFDAVRNGDPRAETIVADLATGVAATVLTVDPQLVVIGGGLSQAGELLTEPLRAELTRRCLFPVHVETSTLGGELVALGAVRLALDHAVCGAAVHGPGQLECALRPGHGRRRLPRRENFDRVRGKGLVEDLDILDAAGEEVLVRIAVLAR